MKKIFFVLIALILLTSTAFSTNVKSKPVYHCNRNNSNRIAITFDDGPHPKHTPEILDILEENNVKATFFLIGQNVKNYPDCAKRILRDGHEVGNHTYSHRVLKSLTREKIEKEITEMENQLSKIANYHPKLIRPPCGMYNDALVKTADETGYKIILWSIDTKDWAHSSTESIVSNVVTNVRGGDIILFHDYISGEDGTPDALKVIIPKLKSMGYEFVTVSELLQSDS